MHFYTIFFNLTSESGGGSGNLLFNGFHQAAQPNDNILRLKLSIDNALLKHMHFERKDELLRPAPEITLSRSSYPVVAARVTSGVNLVTQIGSYFFVMTPLLVFTIILNDILKEKELGLVKVSHLFQPLIDSYRD